MTYVWFHPPRPTDDDTLRTLGISTRPPNGSIVYSFDDDTQQVLAEVAEITVYSDGRIIIWPRRGMTERMVRTVRGCAQLAFTEKPSVKRGWWFRRRGAGKSYWSTAVSVQVPDDDPVVMAVRASRRIERRVPVTVVDADQE